MSKYSRYLKKDLLEIITSLEEDLVEKEEEYKRELEYHQENYSELEKENSDMEASLAVFTDMIPECKNLEMEQELEDLLVPFKLKWKKRGF